MVDIPVLFPSDQPEMKKRQSGRPYLNGGNGDILLLIFYVIQDTSPNTLKALKSVSREFHHLADYVSYRSIVLELDRSNLQAAYDRLRYAEKNQLLPAIQRVDVKDSGAGSYQSDSRVEGPISSLSQYQSFATFMATLLPSMTGLKNLSWLPRDHYNEIAPQHVFQALRSLPKVRLHTKISWQRGPPVKEKMQELPTTNLHKLDAEFYYHGATDCLGYTRPLKDLLLSSPGLRSLHLDIRQPRGGCVVYAAPREYCGLGFTGDEILPPLNELTINNYPWGRKSGSTGRNQRAFSNNYPGEGQEMDHWADTFDWSHLRRLTTSYVDFALKIMPKLVSLKKVEFQNSWTNSDIIRFYLECPTTLESIGADRLECVTLEGILRHGSALKRLRLHTVEGSKWSTKAMDIDSLRAIRDRCPLIEKLYLDIPRKDDWPWDMLDILASFPHLRDLTICFALGLHHDKDPIKPYVTFESVDTIYKYLLSHSPPGQTCKISRFHVYSGAPPPLGYGYPAPSAFWPGNNSTDFVCTLSERDDGAAHGVYELVCPKVLSQRGVPERDLRVARFGPVPRMLCNPMW